MVCVNFKVLSVCLRPLSLISFKKIGSILARYVHNIILFCKYMFSINREHYVAEV